MTSENTPGELNSEPRLTQSRGADPGLLGELAPGSDLGWLGRFEFSGRQFPDPAAGDVTVLAQQAHLLQVIEGHDGRAAGVVHDLEGRLSCHWAK